MENEMNVEESHICVCICTYKRDAYLRRLLRELSDQYTEGLFTYSIVVCDNDHMRSAEAVVSEFSSESRVNIKYCCEMHQNISLARNKTIENSFGEFVAFIDDDEFPEKGWLLNLFNTLKRYDVDGVLGPVVRHFDTPPPKWLLKSDFYARPIYPTGTVLDKDKGRTGNVLLKRSVFDGQGQLFDPEFRGGGDKEFFRRVINKGYRFIWSAEAIAFEVVPPVRWKRSFMIKRALFRGALVPLHSDFGWHQITKSIIAVCTYTVLLPFALLLGQHRFMAIMVSLCDHIGLLLALVGIRPFRQAYITE